MENNLFTKTKQMTGIEKVIKERTEHLTKHQRTVLQDIKNNDKGQLMMAAESLLQSSDGYYDEFKFELIPEGWNETLFLKMFNKPLEERLIIAASLLIAEYDRLTYKNEITELHNTND